jgi:hypothetical protein
MTALAELATQPLLLDERKKVLAVLVDGLAIERLDLRTDLRLIATLLTACCPQASTDPATVARALAEAMTEQRAAIVCEQADEHIEAAQHAETAEFLIAGLAMGFVFAPAPPPYSPTPTNVVALAEWLGR